MCSRYNTRNSPHWENMLDGSWVHPILGIVRKIPASHKFKCDYYGYPEEMQPSLSFGPFIKRSEAIEALVVYREQHPKELRIQRSHKCPGELEPHKRVTWDGVEWRYYVNRGMYHSVRLDKCPDCGEALAA